MSSNLVIVESPAKARTIGGFLGSDYTVVASYGHIRDLPKSEMGVDIADKFEPTYVSNPQQKKRLAELKKLAKDAKTIWLATDEDREGEAIAWHLAKGLGLDPAKTKRIAFHEITAPAIKAAIEHPRTIDQPLVDAQQARRVLDRLVGYELSPVLWKKVQPGLSAGRVQSVALRLVVEREHEIEDFTSKAYYKITGTFQADAETVSATLAVKPTDLGDVKGLFEQAQGSTFTVAELETKPGKRSPAAPFTTSTLQQEASRRLGFSISRTMSLAQRLYEAGKITYMRTDSVQLSKQALDQATSVITSQYGANYTQTRNYTTKSASAQEAHEAIRPTDLSQATTGGDPAERKLYELIWQRTLASQMAEARLQRTRALIQGDKLKEAFEAKGEMIEFDGFLKLYRPTTEEGEDAQAEDKLLPPLKQGQTLPLVTMEGRENYDRPKARYTEASLVRQMEEMGIGRPSTYAPTIGNIQDREYVQKGDITGQERTITIMRLEGEKVTEHRETELYGTDRNKLIPTPLGTLVSDFLTAHFANVVDYDFTAKAETEFDKIEEGKERWNSMIANFYGPFHRQIEDAETISRSEAAGARELGSDPITGKPVMARWGRYGPMVQLGSAEDDEKPRFAPLPAGKRLEEVTLDEALELLQLPREVGQTADGQTITANFGRFGPYIKFGSLYVSIKPDDPFTITVERARELAAEKLESEAEKYLKRFEGSEIVIVKGRFGPFITDGKKNAKVPKDANIEKLTLAECEKLLAAAPVRRKRRVVR